MRWFLCRNTGKIIPQGLKPSFVGLLIGTAKAVPFPKLFSRNFGLSAKIRVNPWRKNFYLTSKLTTAPATTFCPATGDCVTIMLAGEGCAGACSIWMTPVVA